MAKRKTTELTTITASALADGDWFPVVDVSDATDSSTGTNKKIAKSELAEAAGVTTHAAVTSGVHGISAFGATLVDDADAATARSTLGLGTIATQAAGAVAITGGSVTGITDLAIADGGTGGSTAAAALANLTSTTLAADGDILTRSGGAPAAITRANLAADTAFTAQFITPCANGTSSTTARPTSSGVVMWIGAVQPENIAVGDVWVQSALSPLDFSDLSAWFDASVASSITSSGGAVSQWSDLSGNARHATQATAGAKPTTGSVTVNSLNALSFDGGDELAMASLATAANRTTYAVVKANTHDATRRVIIEGSTGTLAYSQVQMEVGAGNQLTALGHDNSTNVYTATAAGTFPIVATIATYRRQDGDTLKIYTNSTESASVAIGAVSDTSATYATIGNARPSTGGRQWKGAICEVLDFNTAHTANQRTAVWNYLATKWGITL